MTNRLRNPMRAKSWIAGLCLFLLPTAWLLAQPAFFNFSYNGPTTLYVDQGCTSMLQGNVPNPVVSSTVGANIILSQFNPVLSGFTYNGLFTAGSVAHVFWDVADDQGHSNTYEYFINFVDNLPPAFDLTGVLDTLEFSSSAAVPPQVALPVMDNCTPVVNDTFYQTTPPPLCQSGTFTRTWKATDANNNTSVFTQTIIIYKDSLPPLITGYPQDGSAPCEQLASAYPAWLAAQTAIFSATDPSGIFSLSNNGPATFPPGCKAPLTVRFKAVDNCMFQLNVDVVFTTSDNAGPVVIIPPKDTVAYCSKTDNEFVKLGEWINKKGYTQAKDTCSGPLSYSMKIGTTVVDSAQVVAAFQANFASGCNTRFIGTKSYQKVHAKITVNFFVKDACGNETAMGDADFGAIDTLAPTITGINVAEQCGGGNDQTSLQSWINAHGNAIVTDDCSGFTWTNFTFVTSTGQTGDGIFNSGPYPTVQANNCSWYTDITFKATDDCNNSNTITLRWSIFDTLKPVFTGLQPDITVYCPNPLPNVPAATVTDNCDANVAITFARVYKDSICDGSYTVETTWTATDDCGNVTNMVQNIFVRDTTKPVFTLVPGPLTFRCDTFMLPLVPVMGINIMATDVCSPVVSITTTTQSFQNPDPGVCGHYTYNIVRTFTATDECGNTQTATQVISVIDNLGPVPGGVLDTTALCSALTPFPAPAPLAVDACSGPTDPPVSSGQTIDPGPCADQYTIRVHWSAEDVCGNKTPFDQLVHVVDTVAPQLLSVPANITVECNAIPAPPANAALNAQDNCLGPVSIILTETEIRNPDTTSCEHWTDYIVKREWTATDQCGNARTYTQLIQIEDTTPPEIIPQQPLVLENDPGICGAEILIPGPMSVTDVCSSQGEFVLLSDLKPLVASGPGSPFVVPVAAMTFSLSTTKTPPFSPAVGAVTLKAIIENADAEGATEDFNVFDENGNLLGTADTDSQCGDKTTNFVLSPIQVNKWLTDGTATFSMVPNGSGPTACNPICPNGKVTAQLSYARESSDVPILLQYSVDGGPQQNYPPSLPELLGTGVHTIVYTATDCVGNSSTASMQITVNDTEPPSLAAPANITVFTGQNNCDGVVMLPFPAITENCAMSASFSLASAVLPLHFANDPDLGIIASDITVQLSGLIPNAVGNGILRIRHKGDNAGAGEFFNVYDEQGNPLGSTTQGAMANECIGFWETAIPVSAANINAWASNPPFGSTSFYLETNRDTNSIGSCGPLLPNGTDGVSQVQVVLEYSYAIVNYSIKNAANQVVSTGSITGNITKDTLSAGNYNVMYQATDNAGLVGMTSFSVTVRDTVKPKALCLSAYILQVDPSGAPDTIKPFQINNGSFDNCTPTPNLTYSVSPNIFTCSQAGMSPMVTLSVTDTSENSSTCKTVIGIFNEPPSPSFTPVCENGILQVFTNPPSPGPYFYTWKGLNNNFFYSGLNANPVVDSTAMAIHNDTYCVTITGAGGCTSSACIQVQLAILSVTPTLNAIPTSYCPGQNVQLSTGTYLGQNVSYQWLQDVNGTPTEISETFVNNFTVNNLAPGTHTFYVKVFANGCATALSNSITITMHPTPPADAVPEMQLKCEGDALSLQSLTPPTGGLTYFWTGPPGSGFTSTDQNPVVPNIMIASQHAGKYILVTQQNGCFSVPDTVMVSINNKPAKPILGGNVNACAGQNVTLVCSNHPNAAQYLWNIPTPSGPVNINTTTNSLLIPGVTNQNEGCYSVEVFANGCFSNQSDPICLDVHDIPMVTANASPSICKDSLLQLSATFSSEVPLTWCWTFPNGSQHFTQNITVPNGSSGIYQVVGKTSYGCADTSTVQVTNVTPPAIGSISNNAPVCCDGTTDAVLMASITSPNTPYTYLWTGPPTFGTSTLANPVIPDVCTPFNGQYTLVVKDSFGCPSLPATTEINIQAPPVTPSLSVTQQPVCAGATITLTIGNPTPGVSYLWNRPGNLPDTTTLVPTLVIPNAQTWHSGNYTVMAISANALCQSGISNSVTVTVNPIPPTPVISSSSPVCEGGVLNLYSNTIPMVSYFWTGPAGFISMAEDPTRSPVTQNMAGEYKLHVEALGCISGETSLMVTVVHTPVTPVIAPPPPAICVDAPFSIFLNIANPVSGMEYTWEDAASGIVLQGPSTINTLSLNEPQVLALGPGSHSFRVVASTPDTPYCRSIYSNVVTVRFDTIPEGVNAFAGLNHPACNSTPIVLNALPNPLPGMVNGLWSQIGTPVVAIDNAGSPVASFLSTDTATTYTFVWSLSNGECRNFSRDTVEIMAQFPEVADAGEDQYVCDPSNIQLHATQGVNTPGAWTQWQPGLGIQIDNVLDPNSTISGNIGLGQNFVFYWVISNPGCGVSSDPVTIYVYSGKPQTSSNQFICSNDDCTVLTVSPLAPFETGEWTCLNNPMVTYTNRFNDTTTVCGLVGGSNIFVWTVNRDSCDLNSNKDTLEVYYEIFPTAFVDNVSVNFGSSAQFNVLSNDDLPDNFTVVITTHPVNGTIVENPATGVYVYRPNSGFTGNDVLTYRICNTQCPDACSIANVNFSVGGAPECFIPTIITPNSDGFNDLFKIPDQCTLGEGAANLEVTIFNQWGDVVFHAKPYLNDWGGTYNNEELPAGTYFFRIKLDSNTEPRTGFLLIQR
ncbi:MAG: gliding motility-associated C-terminal domain-containing protein [Saprospiraceae bacterium]|nr:gliding motility-associated C-terminal domain-containing protein [Saprospiraceae bacterium]